jgi:hypothetical protein
MIFNRKTTFGLIAAAALAPTTFGQIVPKHFPPTGTTITLNECETFDSFVWHFENQAVPVPPAVNRPPVTSVVHAVHGPLPAGFNTNTWFSPSNVAGINTMIHPVSDGSTAMTFTGTDPMSGASASVTVIFDVTGCPPLALLS